MRATISLLVLGLCGCSTAPLADLFDRFAPARLLPADAPLAGGVVAGPPPIQEMPAVPLPASRPLVVPPTLLGGTAPTPNWGTTPGPRVAPALPDFRPTAPPLTPTPSGEGPRLTPP